MQTSRAKRCPDCYGAHWIWGDGKCSRCAGSGKSLSLSYPELECGQCNGSGTCPTCGGTGKLKGVSFALIQPRSTVGKFVLPLAFVGLCVFAVKHARSQYLVKAVAAADVVHREISQGRVSQIYVNADDSFRMNATFEAAVQEMENIRRRLGSCTYSGPAAWSVSVDTRGIYVVTKYRGVCANGQSTETLRWHIVEGIARLAGYRVTSKTLRRPAEQN